MRTRLRRISAPCFGSRGPCRQALRLLFGLRARGSGPARGRRGRSGLPAGGQLCPPGGLVRLAGRSGLERRVCCAQRSAFGIAAAGSCPMDPEVVALLASGSIVVGLLAGLSLWLYYRSRLVERQRLLSTW